MWYKIIEGDESSFPSKAGSYLCKTQYIEYSICHYRPENYKLRFCMTDNQIGNFVLEWHEIPIDEKCKWSYDGDLGICLSMCAGLSYDKEDADYFIYCPRCGKGIEFI